MLKEIIRKIRSIPENQICEGYLYQDDKKCILEHLTKEQKSYLVKTFYKVNDDVHPSFILDNLDNEYIMLGNTPKQRILLALEVLNDLSR